MNKKLDYSKAFAFTNFTLSANPNEYAKSNIDTYWTRQPKYGVTEATDLFTLFEFSAKWDPVPTMLCQNHERVIKGFWGQSVAFDKTYVKPDVLVMGEAKQFNEVRYCHGDFGKGFGPTMADTILKIISTRWMIRQRIYHFIRILPVTASS